MIKPEKKDVEKRRQDLQKQFEDLSEKIKQGRDAIKNMEVTLIGLQGAIQQCDWTLELFKEEKKK